MQQTQRHGEVVHQFVQLLRVVRARQPLGQGLDRVFEVTVFGQRFDEKAQRRPVHVGQAQRQGLAVQMLGEGFLGVHPFRGVGVVIGSSALLARWGVTAPFAVVGSDLGGAVALPAGFFTQDGSFGIILALCACCICVGSS